MLSGGALILRDTAFGGPQDEGLRAMHLLIAMAGTDPRITSGDGHDVQRLSISLGVAFTDVETPYLLCCAAVFDGAPDLLRQ